MNTLKSIMLILLAVILCFYNPVLYMAQKQDNITQLYVSNETTNFINNVKDKGYINSNMLFQYITKIDKTSNLYNIELEHQKEIVIPLYDEETETFLEDYTTQTYITYTTDIYKELEDNGIYELSKGDYISIKVTNRNETMATKLWKAIRFTDVPKEQILVTYGGRVRNER